MLGKRLINSNDAAAGGACTTNNNDYPTTNVAYYKMSTAADEKDTYNGTASNVNFNVQGKFGNAAEFNGSSSYMDTNYTLPTDSTMSFSFWINVDSLPSGDTYILSDLSSSATDRRLDFRLKGSEGGRLYIDIGNGSSNDTTNNTSFVPTLNTWHHIVVTLNGYTIKVYVDNGTPVTLTSSVEFGTAGARSISLGRAGDYNGAYYDGKIDQVRIFSSALSATQAASLYNEVYCVPTIVPSDNFNTVLYTGTGSASKSVTGVGFQPDLVWGKATNSSSLSHILFDVVRGENKQISADLPDAEVVRSSAAYEFDSDGFTVTTAGNLNNPNDFVAWCWKAGGAAVSNSSWYCWE